MATYERLESAINSYGEAVEDSIRDSRPALYLDLGLILIIPIALSAVSGVWAGAVGLGTTLGLGTLNAVDRLARGQTMLKDYWAHGSKLRRSVKTLRIMLESADADQAKLDEVEKQLKDYLVNLS